MAYNYEYPYTDMHRHNDDWMINRVKELSLEWIETRKEWNNTREEFASLKTFIQNYFAQLDLQDEVNVKLDIMARDGTLSALISPLFSEYKKEIDHSMSEQNDKINVLNSRMDTFTSLPDGSTAGDAELQDIRIGYNGKVYPSAGDAVRMQVSQLSSEIDDVKRDLVNNVGEQKILAVGDTVSSIYISNPQAENYLHSSNMNRFMCLKDDDGNKYYFEADSQESLGVIYNSISFFGLNNINGKDYFYDVSSIIINEDVVYYQNNSYFKGVKILLFGGSETVENTNRNKTIYFKKPLTVEYIYASADPFTSDFKNFVQTQKDEYILKESYEFGSLFNSNCLRCGDKIRGIFVGNPQGEHFLDGDFTRFIHLRDDDNNNLYFEVDSSTTVPPMYNRIVLFGLNNNEVYDVGKMLKPNNLVKYNNRSYWNGIDVIPFGGNDSFNDAETNRNCYVFFEKPMTVVSVLNSKYLDLDFRTTTLVNEFDNIENKDTQVGNMSSYVVKNKTFSAGQNLIFASDKGGMITKMQFIAAWNYAVARSYITIVTDGKTYFSGMLYNLCGMDSANLTTESSFIDKYNDLVFETPLFSKKGSRIVTLNYKIPYYQNVRVYLTTPCEALMWNCITVSDKINLDYSGLHIPYGAYLHSQNVNNDNVNPGETLELLNTNKQGALLSFQMFGKGRNVNWCEGCLRAFIKDSSSPIILSSGWEDTFGYCFFFDSGISQHITTGVTLLEKTDDNCTIVAYRNFDSEPLTFEAGGFKLLTRNGDQSSDDFDLSSPDNLIDTGNIGLYPCKMGGQITWYEWGK